jgi:hypothetical protein
MRWWRVRCRGLSQLVVAKREAMPLASDHPGIDARQQFAQHLARRSSFQIQRASTCTCTSEEDEEDQTQTRMQKSKYQYFAISGETLHKDGTRCRKISNNAQPLKIISTISPRIHARRYCSRACDMSVS